MNSLLFPPEVEGNPLSLPLRLPAEGGWGGGEKPLCDSPLPTESEEPSWERGGAHRVREAPALAVR